MRLFSLRTLTQLSLVAALASSSAGCTLTASGHLRVPMIVVEEAPPPPRPRPVVVARADYIWIDGHQSWDGGHYVWQEGRYERERSGYFYAPGRWQARGHGHVWVEGEWRASGRHGRAHVRGH